MVFSSVLFVFCFLPATLFLYFLSGPRYRNVVLLIMSLIFYAWGEPKNILLMIGSIAVNYVLGLLIEKVRYRKIVLAAAIIFNLALLFVFKYLNFAVDVINKFSGSNISITQIALPIGISFFTFQIMSYIIDVYKGTVSAQKNILDLALYVSLFPQLIAGPIVRYVDVEKQIKCRETTEQSVYTGFRRFVIGFSKKVLIADVLARMVDVVFSGQYPSVFGHWIGIIAYSLQIYFDFSGYSDMAIGLGRIFGFDFPENFNYPYISKSIQEFWRRWHISLSTWFRDYLYIPLGGSRCGKLRTYVNTLIVFFLTGLWHGASFNFIVWGLFYAVFLIVERMGLNKVLEKLPGVFRHIYSIFIILIGWVFFRADNLSSAVTYIRDMFVLSGNDWNNFRMIINPEYICIMVLGLFFSVPHTKIMENINRSGVKTAFFDTGLIIIFLIAICYMVGSGYSPFLYFRF